MDKKSEQLGMPFGTACGRLDKQILFWLVKKTGQDTCYRCGKKIEHWKELSTEHKKNWQNVDPTLFWDLENIAFSHKRCNYSAGRIGRVPGNARFDKAPPGMTWCGKHKAYLPVGEFQKTRTYKSGYDYWCRECCKRFGGKGSYGR